MSVEQMSYGAKLGSSMAKKDAQLDPSVSLLTTCIIILMYKDIFIKFYNFSFDASVKVKLSTTVKLFQQVGWIK